LPDVITTLAHGAPGFDQSGEFPDESVHAVHEAGLLTATVGARFGGADVDIAGTTRLLAALGEGDPSVALISAMTLFQHADQATRSQWPAELYDRVLEESTAWPTLLNAARVEPELGSPSRGGLPDTTARRTSSGWAISGTKRFVTGADGLRYFLVWARTDEPVPRVATFVVPASIPGISIVATWDHLGLRASGSHDVVFTDVEIPADHVLGEPIQSERAGQDNLAVAAKGLALSALYLGVGRAAQKSFHRFAWERVPANLGRPVAETDRFRSGAGEVETLLAGAQHVLFGMADRVAREEAPPSTELLAARVLAVRQVTEAVHIAMRLLGNPGLSRTNSLERHFRDVQSAHVHAPQEDTALAVIGKTILERSSA
jgi:alkylation response protein AidB-like acyl-CoA dehydrogenase